MITAPFNFVPLSEKVFFPDWADEVNHDVPFEDAQSGIVDISITAKSPIFVRDGENDTQFCNYNGTHYIPGSSVKGMIRNVLEIMSFSKMSQFNDDTYAVRDLRNKRLYMSKMTPENTMCGWLKKEGEGYVIEDCGKPGRIRHEEIDKIFNIDFASKFKQGKFGNKASDKTAKKKYDMIKSDQFVYGFDFLKTDVNRDVYIYKQSSDKKGTLVLTGQPSARMEPRGEKPKGKIYEFLFFESKDKLQISEKVMDNFLFAYFDERKTEPKESPDWTYWKKKLYAGEKVPVFFQKNGKEVKHFGLSYLYKLPYNHSVKAGLPPAHTDERKDLAQTMFGYIDDDNALKGRVQFSHFKAAHTPKTLEERTVILGTPRASYYPMYVKQQDGKLFSTFMDAGFSISGWKRYPIHAGNKTVSTTDTGNENVGTKLSPLKDGVIFEGKLRYHNLKKAELGALLSALTFHNTEKCFHNIGLAKSLGYGKISLKVNGIENIEVYLKEFETEMSEQVEGWAESEQIKELLSMATEQQNSGNSKLKYMDLPQFASNKTGDQDYLRNYTALDNIQTVTAKSLISEEDLEALRERQEARREKEKLKLEKRKRDEEHKKEWDVVYASTTLSTIEAFIAKYKDSPYLETAHEMIENLKKKAHEAEEKIKEELAKTKWEAVLKVADKYKKKALEDFIENYSDSKFVVEAKEILKSMGGERKPAENVNIDILFSAKDGKKFKKVLKNINIKGQEEALKILVVEYCKEFDDAKKIKFFKDAQIGTKVGKEFEATIKEAVGLKV